MKNENTVIASFWVGGYLVRYNEIGDWQYQDRAAEWHAANDDLRRSISDHLDEHCSADGWPSHEADRALPHRTLGEAMAEGTHRSYVDKYRELADSLQDPDPGDEPWSHKRLCTWSRREGRRVRRASDLKDNTISMLRQRLAESQRETRVARAAQEDVDPWIWSDDDTANTVESLGNTMVVRITGGHLRALIRDGTK